MRWSAFGVGNKRSGRGKNGMRKVSLESAARGMEAWKNGATVSKATTSAHGRIGNRPLAAVVAPLLYRRSRRRAKWKIRGWERGRRAIWCCTEQAERGILPRPQAKSALACHRSIGRRHFQTQEGSRCSA